MPAPGHLWSHCYECLNQSFSKIFPILIPKHLLGTFPKFLLVGLELPVGFSASTFTLGIYLLVTRVLETIILVDHQLRLDETTLYSENPPIDVFSISYPWWIMLPVTAIVVLKHVHMSWSFHSQHLRPCCVSFTTAIFGYFNKFGILMGWFHKETCTNNDKTPNIQTSGLVTTESTPIIQIFWLISALNYKNA